MQAANTATRRRTAKRSVELGSPVDAGELFVRWQRKGDQRAREELVERFLPLARKLARRYMGAREPFDDLLQVASLGLVKAIDRFDPSRGTAFSSFAVPTILGELKRYFRDLGWSVHVPRGAQELALKVEEARQKLTTREREVLVLRFVEDRTQTQIADLIGVSQMQVSRILRRALEQLRELMQPDPPPEALTEARPSGSRAARPGRRPRARARK